jgi:hypothetical protein
MRIVAPVIAPATAAPPPAADVATAAIHDTDTSRQGGQPRNCQPDLDPVNQSIHLIHIQ